MIINNRKDLDAAPADERDRLIAQLGGTINKWRWNDAEWERYADASTIERFGFTLADFPDAPVPDMPDYSPDERDKEQRRDELVAELENIDSRYHSDRSWREHVISHPAEFSTAAVERMQTAEDEAAPLRAELAAINDTIDES